MTHITIQPSRLARIASTSYPRSSREFLATILDTPYSFQRMFSPSFLGVGASLLGLPKQSYGYPVDIYENQDCYRVLVDAPGFSPQDFEVTYTQGALAISARMQEEIPSSPMSSQLAEPLVKQEVVGEYRRSTSCSQVTQKAPEGSSGELSRGVSSSASAGSPSASQFSEKVSSPNSESEVLGGVCWCKQRAWSGFTRSLTLGSEVDASKITASYKDGVLSLFLPKAESAKARKIEVKVS